MFRKLKDSKLRFQNLIWIKLSEKKIAEFITIYQKKLFSQRVKIK